MRVRALEETGNTMAFRDTKGLKRRERPAMHKIDTTMVTLQPAGGASIMKPEGISLPDKAKRQAQLPNAQGGSNDHFRAERSSNRPSTHNHSRTRRRCTRDLVPGRAANPVGSDAEAEAVKDVYSFSAGTHSPLRRSHPLVRLKQDRPDHSTSAPSGATIRPPAISVNSH